MFIRTVRDIKSDFQMLFFFQLFGVKYVMNKELEAAREMYRNVCQVKRIIDDPRSQKKLTNKELVDALKLLKTILGQ